MQQTIINWLELLYDNILKPAEIKRDMFGIQFESV